MEPEYNEPVEEPQMGEDERRELEKEMFTRQDYRLVQFLLKNDVDETEDKTTSNFAADKFWGFKDREIALSNFDEFDIERFKLMFRNVVISHYMSMPPYKVSFSDELMMSNLEALVMAKVKRSTGGRDRERFILGSQIQQRLVDQEEQPTGGMLQKVGRFLGIGGNK